MHSKELEKDLEIIFDKEKTNTQLSIHSQRKKKARASFSRSFFSTYSIKDYPNSETLKSLYLYQENEEDRRQYIIKRLQKEIINSDEDEKEIEKYQSSPSIPINGLSKLCFYTLIQLGFTDEAVQSLFKRKKDVMEYSLFYKGLS